MPEASDIARTRALPGTGADAYFSSIIDAAPDAMLIVDGDGVITFANRQAVEVFGLGLEQLLGSNVDQLLPDDMRSGHRRHRMDYGADPTVRPMGVGMLLRAQRGDGTVFPVEVSLSPLRDGETFQVVAAVRDVTERVEAEAQLQRSEEALRQAEQVLAVADDRERIARDLHDTVIQRLFASGLALQAVTARVDDVIAERLDLVVDDLDQTIREIRSAIFSLQASGPAEAGVRAQILEVVRQASDSVGFEPTLRFEGPIETLDERIVEQLVPTLREALTNVARHARAEAVRVAVEANGTLVELTVLDDGDGIPDAPELGNGLDNMGRRATGLGGALVLEPVEPHGTRLRWSVPVIVPEG